MKRIVSVIIVLVMLLPIMSVSASQNIYGEPFKIRATCYCDHGYTKSGQYVREGIVAGNDELLGKTAILYDMDMNLIGIYEFLDTGGNKHLKNGTRIDVYRPTLAECYDWIEEYGDYVYLQVVDAEG